MNNSRQVMAQHTQTRSATGQSGVQGISQGRTVRQFLVLMGVALTVGCASTEAVDEPREAEIVAEQIEEAPVAEVEKEAPPPPGPEDYPVAPFGKETLFQLLVAEVAGYRGHYDMALDKYVEQAETSRDPGVAARATRLAAYLKQNEDALKAVKIWVEQEPESLDAHRFAADQLMKAGDLEAAIVHMEAIKRLGGLANFDVFAYRAANLDDETRQSLLDAISTMLEEYPGDEQLMFSKAVLLEQSGDLEEALGLANTLLANNNKNINVIVLKVNALKVLHRSEDAIEFLNEAVQELPDNRRLRLIYARFLFEENDLIKARDQYEIVLEMSPNDGDILFALALIAMEQKRDETATKYLHRMVRWNRRASEAHFYLGSIAERRNDYPKALREYKQVSPGYEFLPAQARIVNLMVDQGRLKDARTYMQRMRAENPDENTYQQLIMIEGQLLADRGYDTEALSLLDEAIAANPENVRLLYFRAMTGEKFDQLDILEADLRRIIEIEPENADALNALGYTLTDKTDRHEEAKVLIEKALVLRPDEPAFIDSLGWALYRLGDFEGAEQQLRRALELFQNDEVAAHLGEVLWMMGKELEAREVWEKALELAPESDILEGVIQRLTGE